MRDNSCTAGPFEKQNILPDRPFGSDPRPGATHERVGYSVAPRARYRDPRRNWLRKRRGANGRGRGCGH
jgi:hypothetical protein